LRDIYSSPSKVCLVVNIGDPIDRAAMNTHPQLDVRMISQSSANLERTPHWLFRAMEEQQRHPVSGWHSGEFAACFRRSKTFGVSHDLIQFLEKFNLFVDQQFRITHYID
jgi:hypothetical protein